MYVQIVPIAEQRSLRLTFTMPSSKPYYESKPTRLIGSLIGHEGKGSLLSQLKKENLATGLSAGDQQESYASYFNVRIELTEKGRNDVPRVIELFFAYVDMLRNEGLKEYYFKDRQTVTDLAYYFRDHEEGMDAASSYAASMQDHPALEFEKNERLIATYDPAAFAEFVSYLKPEGLVAILMAPDVVADQTEKHYGTSYGVSRFDEATIAQWKDPKGTDAFQYPEPNPFIASDLSILSNDEHDKPYKLIDDERGAFWFQQDDTFNLPKARVNLLLMTPETGRDPEHRLVAELYARSLNEGLNEWRYDVLEAGLWTDVGAEVRGIRINVNGYSERIPDLLRALSERMQDITIDEATYASIQDNLKREYANAAYDQAYLQTFYEFQFLLDPDAIHRKTYEAMVDDVTLDDVRAFAANVLDRVAIEGIAYGNLDPKTLKKSIKDVVETVSNETLPKAERTEPRELNLPDGTPYAHVFRSKSDNHCWMRFVQFGERDYRRRRSFGSAPRT